MTQFVSVEIDLKVSAEKQWGAFWDSATLFPKTMPSHFKNIEVNGDGNVGTIQKIKYGEGMRGATHLSDKIEAWDKTNMTLTYTVIEGEILNIFEAFKPTMKVMSGTDANSYTVSWTIEFEPAGNQIPPTELIKEATVRIFKTVEGYLLTTT